jgi:hypothetical protein
MATTVAAPSQGVSKAVQAKNSGVSAIQKQIPFGMTTKKQRQQQKQRRSG